MNQSYTQELSVDEALSRADGALRTGDLNLASALFNAVVAHDSSNPVASFGKHKIEFLLNELTGEKNPYTSSLRGQSVSTPEGANAAIAALDRALQSVNSQKDFDASFREENFNKETSHSDTSNLTNPEEAALATQTQFESHISDFDREGFCVIKNIIRPDQVALLKDCAKNAIDNANTIFDKAGNDRLGMHIKDQFYVFFNPSNHFPQLKDINFCDELMSSIRNLLGPNFYLIHDQFTIKNPMNPRNRFGSFGWHQDRYDSESEIETHDPFISCLIPLDDMNHKNGGLRVVPFSNYSKSREPLPHTNGSIEEDVEKYAVTIDCKIGDVIFWSSNTLHSSLPNTSEIDSRWAYIVQFSGTTLSMAERNDCAMRAGQLIGQIRPDPSKPLLHGVQN